MSYDQTPGATQGTLEPPQALTTKYLPAGNGKSADTEDPRIPPNAIWHGECGKWWTGAERSHASCCHRTFSSLSAFDHHRRGGRCSNPAAIGLVARSKPFGDLWGWPGPAGGLNAAFTGDDAPEATP